jgi:hypothetical protein
VWHMDKQQWGLLWTGEQAFWKAVPHLLAAGHHTAEALTEPRKLSIGRSYKIPRLMAAQEGERTQTMRILLSRGIGGIDERTRGLTQRWFDMVDWRAEHVGSAKQGIRRRVESYMHKLEGEVNRQHPARTWVERQKEKSAVQEPEQIPSTSECERHMLRIFMKLRQETTVAAEEARWRAADPSRYLQPVCRGLARLLSHGKVNIKGAQWLAKHIGSRLPPGWGAVWKEQGCSELEGAPTDQLQRARCELPTYHGNSMCTVPSATSWNMPKVSAGVVHTLSTGQRRVRRVQCPPYTHNRSKGRKREVLCTEITGEGNEGRCGD